MKTFTNPEELKQAPPEIQEHLAALIGDGVEPPGLRPPGHAMHERIADGPGYRPLAPLLWTLALHTRARRCSTISPAAPPTGW